MKIITEIHIFKTPENIRKYRALWDTGATETLISSVVVNDLGLKHTSDVMVSTINGSVKTKRYGCGIISHYSDHTRYSVSNSININILSPIEDVIMQAAQCKNIISSSLHGIVLADALGVPRMWKKYNRVQGNGFKFEDYASSIGGILRPNVWKLANQYVVKQKQDQLREIFSCL
jgi:hypothetical protein